MAQIGPACGAQEPVRGATTYCTHSMQYHIARRTRPCHESPPLVGAQQAATLLPWPGNGDGHSLCWARSPMTATGGAHQGLGVARRGALSRPGSRPAPSGLPRAARPYSTGRAFAESQRYVPIDPMRTPATPENQVPRSRLWGMQLSHSYSQTYMAVSTVDIHCDARCINQPSSYAAAAFVFLVSPGIHTGLRPCRVRQTVNRSTVAQTYMAAQPFGSVGKVLYLAWSF
jgi:hypothetical protein